MAFTTADTAHNGRRPIGWWSRRHQSREAQDQARDEYFATHPNKKPHKK